MNGKAFNVFLRVLVFGLLLGASATAYADTVVITLVNVSNLQFTATTGTAVFTATGASARATSSNSFGQTVDRFSTGLPFAEAGAPVSLATTFASANLPANSVVGITFAMLGACNCTGTAVSLSTLSFLKKRRS